MEFEKLYLFNPFTIQNADSKLIGDTYTNLQNALIEEANSGFQIARNIEIYANMNYLIGEMIARIQEEYDKLKTDINIRKHTEMHMQRSTWPESKLGKPPAMSYFEALAEEVVKEDIKKLAEINSRLFRFKKAYESTDSKQNALKKKMEAIRYEL